MCTELRRAGTWGCQGTVLGRGIGHWSPWLNHGVPQPLSHAPICETSVCRVQGPGPWHLEGMAVWKGTRPGRRGVGKEVPMGWKWEEGRSRGKVLGSQDQGFRIRCQRKTAPQPQLKFGTNNPQNTSGQGFSPPLVPLEPSRRGSFPCRLRSPLGGHLTHPFTFFRPVSDQDLAPWPPPPASQRADLILSPTMKPSPLALLPSTSASPFLQPWQLRAERAGHRQGMGS